MGRFRFSLAVLFRAQTLVVFALAWLLAIRSAPPAAVMNALVILGLVLAAVVGWRRHERPVTRVAVGLGFLAGAVLFAIYSAHAAATLQAPDPVRGEHPWKSLDTGLSLFGLILWSPAMAAILLMMLRSWTWSAHDREIYRQHRV